LLSNLQRYLTHGPHRTDYLAVQAVSLCVDEWATEQAAAHPGNTRNTVILRTIEPQTVVILAKQSSSKLRSPIVYLRVAG
jgi:hypothetical protein